MIFTSANTCMAGLTAKYRKAVCVVAPAIIDTHTIRGKEMMPAVRIPHLSSWGMTTAGTRRPFPCPARCTETDGCTEFLLYMEDAIRKVRDGPIAQYIPDFNWSLVHEHMGPSPMFNDLVPAKALSDGARDHKDTESAAGDVKSIVCKVLDIAHEDISADVPFTSYGLDSLSAAVLSYSLRPFISISQIQLLAYITLQELEERVAQKTPAKVSTLRLDVYAHS